jgi:hypothetical protein
MPSTPLGAYSATLCQGFASSPSMYEAADRPVCLSSNTSSRTMRSQEFRTRAESWIQR